MVDAPIGLDKTSDDPVRRAINTDGQHAATRFEVIDVGMDGALLLTCILEKSGRTHQIRLHAKHFGAPLLGDEMYGGQNVVIHPAAPKESCSSCLAVGSSTSTFETTIAVEGTSPCGFVGKSSKGLALTFRNL